MAYICTHVCYTCIYLYINVWSVVCLKILNTGMCGIKFLVDVRNLFNLCRFRIGIQLLMYKRQNDCEFWVCRYLNFYKITDGERNCVCCYTNPKHLFIFAFLSVVASLYLVFSVIIQVNTLSASAVIRAKEGREI